MEGARLSTAWSASRSPILLSSTCVGRGPIPFDAPWRSAGRRQRQHLASNRYRRTSTILESSVGARAGWFETAIRLVCLLMSGGERAPQGEVIAAFEAAGQPLEQRSCAKRKLLQGFRPLVLKVRKPRDRSAGPLE
jgi:hypothetical protein